VSQPEAGTNPHGRLPGLAPADLDDAQRALYDTIAGGPRAQNRTVPLADADGHLLGPFNAMLLSPTLGGPLQEVGSAIRYRSVLPPRLREMLILTVATYTGCSFERYAHEPPGRAAGLTEEEIAGLRSESFAPADPGEAAACQVAVRLLTRKPVNDELYAAALSALGEPGVFELSTLVGYYATLAMQMSLFGVTAPTEGRE
jgi:4-carboxymuconolactone decarboxylase